MRDKQLCRRRRSKQKSFAEKEKKITESEIENRRFVENLLPLSLSLSLSLSHYILYVQPVEFSPDTLFMVLTLFFFSSIESPHDLCSVKGKKRFKFTEEQKKLANSFQSAA